MSGHGFTTSGGAGAPGPAGSANISGTANRVIKFTDTTVGGNSAITDDGATVTSTLPVVAQVDAVGTGTTAGLSAKNATVTTSGQVQRSPRIEMTGRAFVSGADTAFAGYLQLIPTTGGNYRITFSRLINVTESDAGYFTNSTPGQFVGALAASSGFASLSNGGFFFDSDYSGLFRGGSGGLQVISRATGDYLLIRSPVTPGSTEAIRIYLNGGDWSASQTMLTIGDMVAAAWNQLIAIKGDGVIEAPTMHVDATVKTADFTATLWTSHMVDLSGAAIAPTIPAAAAANAGCELEIVQTVAGTANLVITPVSGNVEGAATLTIAGLASAPLRSIRLRSMGVGTGSPGWKVVAIV